MPNRLFAPLSPQSLAAYDDFSCAVDPATIGDEMADRRQRGAAWGGLTTIQ
jgi:hypothetical protein